MGWRTVETVCGDAVSKLSNPRNAYGIATDRKWGVEQPERKLQSSLTPSMSVLFYGAVGSENGVEKSFNAVHVSGLLTTLTDEPPGKTKFVFLNCGF